MPLGRCYNLRTGNPKIRYLDWDGAQVAAGEVNARNRARGWDRKPVGPYHCPVHRCYHVGRPRDPMPPQPTLRDELGDRAWTNLANENRGDRVVRIRVLLKRIRRAETRREMKRTLAQMRQDQRNAQSEADRIKRLIDQDDKTNIGRLRQLVTSYELAKTDVGRYAAEAGREEVRLEAVAKAEKEAREKAEKEKK